jgi:myo-inositol-1(or 4)-monophosphatase
MERFLKTAEPIVRRAGDRAAAMAASCEVRREKAGRDIVTDGDLAVEEEVINALRAEFPDHGFYSEERAPENEQAEYVWVLDPIDGTKHYARQLPYWSVSLGLERDGEPVAGLVYAPELGRMFSAADGLGAFCNAQPIRCSDEGELADAFLCAEIPHAETEQVHRRWAMDTLRKLMERCLRVRIIGAGALGLTFTAAGGFDAYVNLGSNFKKVDYSAGQAILAEASARFELSEKTVLAGPPGLVEALRDVLEE